ncbi:MAG: sigma factor [Lentisphaeria bacterium]|nr:sigma factor [Lentisphaeria bacterium]
MPSINYLATMAKLGLASPAQMEELGRGTLAIARCAVRVACQRQLLRRDDIEDVVQATCIKALRRLPKWQLEKGQWQTYVSVIAASAVADQGRRYKRDQRLYAALAKERGGTVEN